jgi:hypothetical protein
MEGQWVIDKPMSYLRKLLVLIGLLTEFTLVAALAQKATTPPPPSFLNFNERLYLSLPWIESTIGASNKSTIIDTMGASFAAGDSSWEFLNGGDRVRLPDNSVQMLSRPLLVVAKSLYLDSQDAKKLFQLEIGGDSIRFRGKESKLTPVNIVSRYRCHQVSELTVTNLAFRLSQNISATVCLQARSNPVELQRGKTYLCRRNATVDGTNYWLITDCGPDPVSFLVDAESIHGKWEKTALENTCWSRYRTWFDQQAANDAGLDRSDDSQLKGRLAVTVDLCWSLRPFEETFFDSIPRLALENGGAAATVFVSGRWIDQHPAEMEALIDLSHKPGVDLTWGLHSWVHPKSGGFMNDLSPEAVREDTLRLERELFAWGIVPTVYYRFPGLIHDEARLRTILAMDLLPIDSDAWVAVQGGTHPHGRPTRDGSIVLVHGNGNEPRGVARFEKWMAENPGWKWAGLSLFLPR